MATSTSEHPTNGSCVGRVRQCLRCPVMTTSRGGPWALVNAVMNLRVP